jgi:thiol:disulfide interchange protein DsbD
MKRLYTILLTFLIVCSASAQMVDPVHFTAQLKELANGEAEIIFTGKIDAGWHVYSTDLDGGPIAANFNKVKMEGAETVGKLKPRGNELKKFDKLFGMDVRYFEGAATFVQKIKFTKEKYTIDCYLEYGACNDEMCMPPSSVEFKKSGSLTPDPSPTERGGSEASSDTAQLSTPNSQLSTPNSQLPLYDRLVWMLPPQVGRRLVMLYRWVINKKQKNL